MPYFVLWGETYELLAEAIEGNGGKAYRHYECIEEAGADAPFTSIRDRGSYLEISYEHPDPSHNYTSKLLYSRSMADWDGIGRKLVEGAERS